MKHLLAGRLSRRLGVLALPIALVGASLVLLRGRGAPDGPRSAVEPRADDDLAESESSWAEWRAGPAVLVRT